MGLVRLPCFFYCVPGTSYKKVFNDFVKPGDEDPPLRPRSNLESRIRTRDERDERTSGRADRSPFQNMAGPRPISAAILFLVLGLSSLTTSGIAYVFHMNTVTVSFWLIVLALFISASSPAFNLNLSRYLSPGAIHPTT
jgi:hypothetical protein